LGKEFQGADGAAAAGRDLELPARTVATKPLPGSENTIVFHYKVAYRLQMGAFFAEVLDFPEVTAIGPTLADARANLCQVLRYAAQRLLRRGELLPLPNPDAQAADAYGVEFVGVMPTDDEQVWVQPQSQ
jgi:predicted RNase H-like HicB family nuclease